MTVRDVGAEPLYEIFNDYLTEGGGRKARGIPWPAMNAGQRERWVRLAVYLSGLDLPYCTGARLYGMAQSSELSTGRATTPATVWWPNWDTLFPQHRWAWEKTAADLYPPEPFQPGELRSRLSELEKLMGEQDLAWHNLTVEVNERIEANRVR